MAGYVSSGAPGAIGQAASDLFGGFEQRSADDLKAQGLEVEGEDYGLASQLALQNEQITQASTDVQEFQESRELSLAQGKTTSEVANAGFSGTSVTGEYIMRSNAQQGAMQQQMTREQGLTTEAGEQEQASAYANMEASANFEAEKEKHEGNVAEFGGIVGAALSVASIFSGAGGSPGGAGSSGGAGGGGGA